jgi:hypothetical protein
MRHNITTNDKHIHAHHSDWYKLAIYGVLIVFQYGAFLLFLFFSSSVKYESLLVGIEWYIL